MHSLSPLFTIGTSGTSAQSFFERLQGAGVRRVWDTRLWGTSQLAGFAKKADLPFLLRAVADMPYEAYPELAPSADILKAFKNKATDWQEYTRRYLALLDARHIAQRLDPDALAGTCLLCACALPHNCHRSLLAHYIERAWPQRFTVQHL
ncbi:MAG: DUF488 domain-containing protein [Alphaproteobacteria bacterium]|jgi:uncharacterized protein YeaO (DUF488 family)|nr:DUF488 domain-containing protein [Alphaproteobacteria bacterium]